MSNERILVVDDEEVIRGILKKSFEFWGYSCDIAQDGKEALEKINSKIFYNLLLTDLKMPHLGGMEILKEIKKTNPYIEVIILTGHPTVDSAVEALKIGASDYLVKPFELEDLRQTVSKCLQRQKFNIQHIELSELMSLFEVSRTISATTGFDILLPKIIDSALEITKARNGSLLLLDEKTNLLKIKVARGLSEEVINSTSIAFGQGISGKVAEGGKPLVGNIEEFAKLHKGINLGYESKSSSEHSFVSLPLGSQNRVLGVINVSDKVSGESFTERELTLLSILAGQAAVAIENAKLYTELQDKISDLKETLDILNQTQVQLIQSEKLAALGRFSSGIAHEVKNPLAIILGGIEFLENRLVNADEDSRTALSKMKESTLRANNILLNLLKFARPSELKVERIKPEDLINDTVNLFKYRAPVRGITIESQYPDNPLVIDVDKNQIQQVLFNLFSNATDAMPGGGQINIRAYKSQKPEEFLSDNIPALVLEVSDTGEGISPDNLKRMFEPFFTTKRDKKGTGLGLSMSKKIIDNHKGKMLVDSELGKGTTIKIVLPLPLGGG
jgi:signal transduction histidine kinase/DNA-binding response OmpR family regulator